MPLRLIHGPPNSGRAELLEGLFREALERDPVLVLPTRDDVYGFERRLSAAGAILGGSVLTFADLFRVVHAAGGGEGAPELTPAQRLAAVGAAIRARRRRLGPLRRSAARPGFTVPFEHLLDELQSAGLEPESLGSGAGTLEASAYLGDLTELFAGYAELRDRLGHSDAHVVAREAVALLRAAPRSWRERPVFLYEPGELTANQRDLLGELAAATEVTVAVAYEPDDPALATRASLLETLRAIGADEEVHTEAVRPVPDAAPTVLRSAGERGEAESIGAQVAKLVAAGADPAAIAIALRDPVRRGPLLVEVLESYGIAVALEAELPLAATAVGGTLLALLEAEFGGGGVDDLLRFLRGPCGQSRRRVDWFERALRRRRVRGSSAALELWEERYEELPGDLAKLRAAAAEGDAALASAVGRLATTMASRPLRGETDGPGLERGDGLELRAAAALATALEELAALPALAPRPAELAATLRQLRFRAWSGPIEGRVRIASPYRLRASRFDHVFVASLQDGEFPRRDRGGDPFLAEPQRRALGLEPRRDPEAEERYLFHACLALPRERLFLSYRDSDENGVAEPRSPFLDEFEAAPIVSRDLTQIVHAPYEAPSPRELARAIAARGPGADATALLSGAGAGNGAGAQVADWLQTAARAERASRAPGPIANPAVLESLAAVSAYGGTTLEGFDVCSYRWLVSHELDPQPLDPAPDPLVQGGLMHEVLYQLYRERPGGDPLPRQASLAVWLARGHELVGETIAARGLGGHPAERAIARRVEGLLARFLADEAGRDTGGFEPWLLEAGFGEAEESERPKLEIDGWGLHGAIDRVDRGADGRALVLDYKLARAVTARKKFEEQAKLQLQLYLIAVAELWGAQPVGGLYHPLRGTSERRPRGAVLAADAAVLGYRLYDPDLVDEESFEQVLADARRRAGEIVARMRRGDVRRDPGPRPGLRGHDICPAYCDFAPICRRDRAPLPADDEDER